MTAQHFNGETTCLVTTKFYSWETSHVTHNSSKHRATCRLLKLALLANRKFKAKDGEMREETTFVDCEAWGGTAETMAKYLSKGRPVFIEGRLKLDQWQDKDGNNRSKLRVVHRKFPIHR